MFTHVSNDKVLSGVHTCPISSPFGPALEMPGTGAPAPINARAHISQRVRRRRPAAQLFAASPGLRSPELHPPTMVLDDGYAWCVGESSSLCRGRLGHIGRLEPWHWCG
jgi:hypothetical protein